MDYKLELVLLPVSDVDRAKAFYEKAGFRLDVDHRAGDQFRVVQFTPPGSACSVAFGIGIFPGDEPSAVIGLHLVVTDIEKARAELVEHGVEVGDVRHMGEGWQPGADPDHTDYSSFAELADPDGNTWLLQEVGYGAAT